MSKTLELSPADRLNLAWKPIVEDLEARKLMGADTIQALPFLLDFNSNRDELVDKDGQGTGFTRVQLNSNAANSYLPGLIDLDTTAGVLKLTTTGNATAGGNSGSDNSLVNALETQFDGTTSGFVIQSRLKGPLSYLNDPYEQGGIYFGPDQDNYVKLVAIRQPSGNFLQFRDEQSTATGTTTTLPGGSTAQEVPIGSFGSINTLDLRLVGDAASGRVTAFYSVNGGAFVKVSAELTLTGTKKAAFFNSASRAGIMAFHKNNVGPITVTFDSFQISAGTSTAGRPTITGTRPGNGETNVSRDAFVAADLNLPNIGGGVDASTLTSTNVRLIRTSDGQLIPGSIDTTGGGDAIVYQPSTPLAANTGYTFIVTDGVRDTTGAAFIPFTSTFTTGTAGGVVDSSVAFEQIQLPNTFGNAWTSVTEGPDGKLYGTTIDGKIVRFTINSDGTVGTGQLINTIINREGGPRMTLSIAFAPNSTASNLIAYVSHGQYAGLPGLPLASNFTGKITKLTGANLQTAQDVVVGLPRSVKDHQNYQAVFGPNGRLYVNVSSMSAKGAPDNAWGLKEEVLLSAAILEIDVNAIGTGTIDVNSTGANPYNPFATNAPVKIYAEGLRSAYDILFHTNGNMYSATNGSAAGGNTPAKPGVAGTQLTNVATQNDYMFRIQQGKYYGHPNPLRGDYILGGGNPTSGADPFEIEPTPERPSAYPVGTQPESNFGGIAYNFGKNYSPNGMIEYRGNAFGGALNGKILIVRYSGGDDILVMTPGSNGTISDAKSGFQGFTGFVDPLDITQASGTGFLYVAEYGGQRITLLRPITPGGGVAEITNRDLRFNDVTSTSATTTGNRSKVTITNTGTGTLTISQAVFSGANGNNFSLTGGSTVPLSIAAGQTATLNIAFTATSTGIKTGTLTLSTNDPNRAQIAISLRGIGTSGEGGTNEPALQRVLDLYFGTNTIRTGGSESVLDFPQNPSSPDEVSLQKLLKAGPGDVTVEILANFANSVSPSSRLGWYQPGNVGSLNRLLNISQADAQSVNVTPAGVTSFDPGSAEFGLYGQFPAFTDRVVYSEHSLNAFETNANRKQKVRFYQLKNADGSVVPNAYVFTFEEWNVSYDQNDIIGIIRNVRAAPAGPEIGLENRDGAFMFPDRLVFNNVNVLDEDLPNQVHDTAVLRINNSGTQPLNITSIVLSNSDWQITSGGGAATISAGGFKDVTVKFVYKRTVRGNEIRSGMLTINSNDADEPAKQVELRGVAQRNSENDEEPSAVTLLSAFGYNVKVLNTGQSLGNGGQRVKVGEEVLSDFWAKAEGGLNVTVRMLAAYHQQAIDKASSIRWFNQTTTPPSSTTLIFKHLAADGQSILPRLDSTSPNPNPAIVSFNPGTNNFGIRVDGQWSVADWNVPNSINQGGHAMRWYIAKDRAGKIIPNTYILLHDYTGSSVTNYDYQDNIYIISNIKPVTPSVAPTALSGTSSGAGIFLNWADNTEGNTLGYNVYRSSSAGGVFTLLNSSPVTQSQYTDPTAPVGQTSFYRITTVNVHGTESAPATTSAVRLTDTVAPSAPSNLVAQGTASGITLDWSDNTEADLAGYNIYRSSSSNGTFTKLNTTGLRSQSDFVDASAPSGATSFYRVTAVDLSGNESAVAAISAFRPTSGSTPTGATSLNASAQNGSTVLLTWADNSNNETGFRVERRLASSQTWISVGTANTNATSFTDTTAAPGTAYAYRVIAFNASGDGASSNEAAVSTPGAGSVAPSNLVATVAGNSVINLTWIDNNTDETGFRIERRTGGSGAWASIGTAAANATTFAATGLLEGTSYSFRVIALTPSGDSAPSNESSAVTSSQFTSSDIGNPLPAGSTQTITNSLDYNLITGGADIWGTADSFRFAYKTITGDFDVSVRVTGTGNTHPTAQAGLMARASITSSSANVIMRTDSSNRFRFGYRTTTGGTTTAVGSATHPAGQGYLRLQRVGNTFTGYSSTDGVNWTVTSSITINMGSSVFVGLAGSSKNVSQTNTIEFRSFNDGGTPAPTAPTAPSGLAATEGTNSQVALTWADNSNNETGFRVERKTGTGAYVTIATLPAGQTAYLDTTSAAGTTYTYRVIATGTPADSLPSNEATITTAGATVTDGSTSTDIAAAPAGTTTVVTANTDYNIVAGGLNIADSSDSFRFVHFAKNGDFDMKVRVDSLTGATGLVPQAGLMARDGTAANARNINLRFDTNNSVMFKYRTSTGGTTTYATNIPNISGPVWLRLTRSGNTFTGFYSTNGTTWITVRSVSISMPTALRVGMAVTARSDTQTATAQFRAFELL